MPPKRKRAEDAPGAEASSTRATRSSARQSTTITETSNSTSKPATAKGATTKPTTKSSKTSASKAPLPTQSSEPEDSDSDSAEPPPPTKKTRTKAAASSMSELKSKAKKKESNKPQKGAAASSDDEHESLDDVPGPSKPTKKTSAAVSKPKAIAPVKAKAQAAPSKVETYSLARADALFKNYADADDPSLIGPEGFEKLCSDTQIPLDGALPLILAWQLDAKEMGKFTKAEWSKSMESLKIVSLSQLSMAVTDLEDLLILDKPPLKRPAASARKSEPYDRSAYWKYTDDSKAAFRKLYSFCFALAKPEQSRNIDMETSVAFWSVLLVPKYPLMAEVVEYINEKGSYKATNKDLWSMMLEFCQTVKPDLQDYEADGAWPTLLDDFVAWKKAKLPA